MLTELQRRQLNESIVGYLQKTIGGEAAQPIAQALGVEAVPDDMRGRLELKWAALVHLQMKIQALEADVKVLKQAKHSGASQSSDGLPSEAVHVLEEHSKSITCVAVHRKWTAAASGSEDGSIKIWNTESGERELTIKAHTRTVTGVDFGDKILVSCSSDGYVRIFDAENKYTNIKTLVGHEHTVSAVRLFANDEKIASCSRDSTIRIWDTKSGYCTQVIKTHTGWVRTLDVCPLGSGLISAGHDLEVYISPLAPGQQPIAFVGHENAVNCCAIAPESADHNIAKLHGLDEPVASSFRFNYFATGSRDKTIILWSSRIGKVATLVGHDNWVRGLYFHPNGRFLLSVGDDKTLRIWDLQNDAKLYKTIEAHEHFVTSIAGKQKLTLTGSVDCKVKVW